MVRTTPREVSRFHELKGILFEGRNKRYLFRRRKVEFVQGGTHTDQHAAGIVVVVFVFVWILAMIVLDERRPFDHHGRCT